MITGVFELNDVHHCTIESQNTQSHSLVPIQYNEYIVLYRTHNCNLQCTDKSTFLFHTEHTIKLFIQSLIPHSIHTIQYNRNRTYLQPHRRDNGSLAYPQTPNHFQTYCSACSYYMIHQLVCPIFTKILPVLYRCTWNSNPLKFQ